MRDRGCEVVRAQFCPEDWGLGGYPPIPIDKELQEQPPPPLFRGPLAVPERLVLVNGVPVIGCRESLTS
jgi:hypothetical protein